MALRTLPSPWLVLTLFAAVSSCQQNEPTCHSESTKLFGQPSENTGLSEAQCSPRCDHCGDAEFVPPDYSAGFVDWLLARQHQNPPQRRRELVHTAVPSSQMSQARDFFVSLSSRLTEYDTDLKLIQRILGCPLNRNLLPP